MESNELVSGCASFAKSDLSVLADQRRETGIHVVADGERVWVAWGGNGERVLERVLGLTGSVVYEHRDGFWFRRGCRLPSFGLPVDREEGISLARAIVPGALRPARGPVERPVPAQLSLVPEERPREATAIRGSLRDLVAWAETATSAQLSKLRGVYAGGEVFLLGKRPPSLRGATRFWGDEVLTPLGWRPEPALEAAALRTALGIASGELLLLEADGVETIPRDVLRPVTRAGIRLAWEREARTV